MRERERASKKEREREGEREGERERDVHSVHSIIPYLATQIEEELQYRRHFEIVTNYKIYTNLQSLCQKWYKLQNHVQGDMQVVVIGDGGGVCLAYMYLHYKSHVEAPRH